MLCSAVAGSALELATTADLPLFTLMVITGTNLAINVLGQQISRGAVECDSGGRLYVWSSGPANTLRAPVASIFCRAHHRPGKSPASAPNET